MKKTRTLLCKVLFFSTINIFAQSQGLLESFKSLISADKRLMSYYSKETNIPYVIRSKKDLDHKNYKYSIHQDYLNSLFLHNSENIIHQIKNNTCKLYEYLSLDLIQHPILKNDLILSQYNIKNKNKRFVKANKRVYLEDLLKRCPNAIANATLLRKKNYKLLKRFNFEKLLNHKSCLSSIQDLAHSPNFSYLAKMAIDSSKNPKINKSITPEQARGLNLFAKYIKGDKNICQVQEGKNIFNLKNDPVVFQNLLKPLCKDYFKTYRKLKNKEISSCLENIKRNPNFCYTHKTRFNRAFYPLQDCISLAENYILSKNKNLASDCPGKIPNEGIVNASRILSLIQPSKQENHCFSDKLNKLINFSNEEGIENLWDVNLCYFNNLYKEKRCKKVLFGKTDSSINYSKVIERILKEAKFIKSGSSCSLTRYKVLSLGEINQGCKIQMNTEKCSLHTCPFSVFINGKKIKHGITSQSSIALNYLSRTNKDYSTSFENLLISKFNFRKSAIKDFTILKRFLNKEKVIIHGVGCAEDLLPQAFMRLSFNDCTPLPFLISGVKSGLGNIEDVLMNLSIDNMINTREISWNEISSSISTFYKLFNNWSLNAIYKD